MTPQHNKPQSNRQDGKERLLQRLPLKARGKQWQAPTASASVLCELLVALAGSKFLFSFLFRTVEAWKTLSVVSTAAPERREDYALTLNSPPSISVVPQLLNKIAKGPNPVHKD